MSHKQSKFKEVRYLNNIKKWVIQRRENPLICLLYITNKLVLSFQTNNKQLKYTLAKERPPSTMGMINKREAKCPRATHQAMWWTLQARSKPTILARRSGSSTTKTSIITRLQWTSKKNYSMSNRTYSKEQLVHITRTLEVWQQTLGKWSPALSIDKTWESKWTWTRRTGARAQQGCSISRIQTRLCCLITQSIPTMTRHRISLTTCSIPPLKWAHPKKILMIMQITYGNSDSRKLTFNRAFRMYVSREVSKWE
jgi:hypothetical protein